MPKYDIKKTKKLKFARYGGLSSVNQEGYDPHTEDYHGPPSRRGFYCFVWPYIELFLLGADCTKDPKTIGAKFTYVRDKNGNLIHEHHHDFNRLCEGNKSWSTNTPEYAKFEKENEKLYVDDYDAYRKKCDELFGLNKLPRWVLVEKPHPRLFEYSGEIWHHLGAHLKPHLILASKGNWVKTDMDSYRYALECEMHKAHKSMMSWCYKDASDKYRFIPTKESALRRQCRDHLEVFIEKL